MTRQHCIAIICAAALLTAGPATAGEAPQGAINNGIQVHGHWKIEVLEPDGTLVSTTEFENALTSPSGFQVLTNLLVEKMVLGAWAVVLENLPSGPDVCFDGPGSSDAPCFLTETGASWGVGGYAQSTNLWVRTEGFIVTITGSVVAGPGGVINEVSTISKVCYGNALPGTCLAEPTNFSILGFTSTTLSPSVSVGAGQIIQVTVTISFSSPTP